MGPELIALDAASLGVLERWRPQTITELDSRGTLHMGEGGGVIHELLGSVSFYEPEGGGLRRVWSARLGDGAVTEPGARRMYGRSSVVDLGTRQVLREFQHGPEQWAGHPDHPYVYGYRMPRANERDGARINVFERATMRPRFSFRIEPLYAPPMIATPGGVLFVFQDRLEFIPVSDLPEDPEAAER